MFGYNYWGVFSTDGMTFEFVVEKKQFWTWRKKLKCSYVADSDTWTII